MRTKSYPSTFGIENSAAAIQATAQANVGLVYRAKRLLMIGDQRQLEAVVPLPSALDDHFISELTASTANTVRVSVSSVQSLADTQMSIGTLTAGHGSEQRLGNNVGEWIGLPLTEHRRCLEPMFSLPYSHRL